jgi:cholesterol transport system auxiliary component
MPRTYRRRGGIAPPLVLLALSLQACGPLLPVAGPPPNVYTVRAKTSISVPQPSVEWRLVIAEPVSPAWLDTDRIAILPGPNELRYYANARWAERAPRLVQTVLLESFLAARESPVVGRALQGLNADFVLKGALQDFAARYEGGATPRVHVRLRAIIAAEPNGEVIAAREFAETARAENEDVLAVVATFERLLGQVAENVVRWSFALPLEKPVSVKATPAPAGREAEKPRAAPREGPVSAPLGAPNGKTLPALSPPSP